MVLLVIRGGRGMIGLRSGGEGEWDDRSSAEVMAEALTVVKEVFPSAVVVEGEMGRIWDEYPGET